MKKIILAGGCFWGIEELFENLEGVIGTSVGYAQSDFENPSYEQVCSGKTNAVEACEIKFDEKTISEDKLLKILFNAIDLTVKNQQGPDIGSQYRSGIYFIDDVQKNISEREFAELQKKSSKKLFFEIVPLKNYYLAEKYHQQYFSKRKNY